MRSAIREKTVDQMLVRTLKRHGIESWKTASVMKRGFPDRALAGPGERHGFVELKTRSGVITKMQQRVLDILARSGAFVRVLRGGSTREETQELIDELVTAYLEMVPVDLGA